MISDQERIAFELIMKYIKEHDSCNMETYDCYAEHNESVNNEQYFSSVHDDRFCYRSNMEKHYLVVSLQYSGDEEMTIIIHKRNDEGFRFINFEYVKDSDDEDTYWWADFNLKLYETEEEYFQASTVDDLVLSPEENKMFIDFNNAFTQHVVKRIGEKHYGQSTS